MRILLVDDESIIRRALRRAMELRGHNVVEAADGSSGLSFWQSSQFDAIIVDFQMPTMNGLEMIKLGLVSGAKTKAIVLMSADKAATDSLSQIDFSPTRFLPKPFRDVFEVVSLIETLVAQKA